MLGRAGWRGAAAFMLSTTIAVATTGCGDSGRSHVLVVYSSLGPELLRFAERTFEAEFDSVDVRIVGLSDEDALARMRAGAGQGDVWWGASAGTLTAAAGDGLLDAYRPEWLSEPGIGSLDALDRWQPSLMSPLVLAFNRETVELTRAPRDWIDLFHMRWRDELLLLDPNEDEGIAALLGGALIRAVRDGHPEAGWDWLLRLDAARPPSEPYEGDVDQLIRRLGQGDGLVAILPRYAAEAARHNDAPWLYYRIPESGTPVLVRGVAVLAGAPEVALAQSFVDFTGTPPMRTQAVQLTRWSPAQGDVDASALPDDFELAASWSAWTPAPDTLAAELPGWLARWNREVRGLGRNRY